MDVVADIDGGGGYEYFLKGVEIGYYNFYQLCPNKQTHAQGQQ